MKRRRRRAVGLRAGDTLSVLALASTTCAPSRWGLLLPPASAFVAPVVVRHTKRPVLSVNTRRRPGGGGGGSGIGAAALVFRLYADTTDAPATTTPDDEEGPPKKKKTYEFFGPNKNPGDAMANVDPAIRHLQPFEPMDFFGGDLSEDETDPDEYLTEWPTYTDHEDHADPTRGFDWDDHISDITHEDLDDMTARSKLQDQQLAGAKEWIPETREDRQLATDVRGGDYALDAFSLERRPDAFFKGFTDVDPEAYDYRNPPAGDGASWSRIRLKSDWHQFDDELNLKEGFVSFDCKGFDVPDCLFEPTLTYDFGHLDPIFLARLAPALKALGTTIRVMEARPPNVLRIKYLSNARHFVGVDAYARGIIAETVPEVDDWDITWETLRTVDETDGASAWAGAIDRGEETDLY